MNHVVDVLGAFFVVIIVGGFLALAISKARYAATTKSVEERSDHILITFEWNETQRIEKADIKSISNRSYGWIAYHPILLLRGAHYGQPHLFKQRYAIIKLKNGFINHLIVPEDIFLRRP